MAPAAPAGPLSCGNGGAGANPFRRLFRMTSRACFLCSRLRPSRSIDNVLFGRINPSGLVASPAATHPNSPDPPASTTGGIKGIFKGVVSYVLGTSGQGDDGSGQHDQKGSRPASHHADLDPAAASILVTEDLDPEHGETDRAANVVDAGLPDPAAQPDLSATTEVSGERGVAHGQSSGDSHQAIASDQVAGHGGSATIEVSPARAEIPSVTVNSMQSGSSDGRDQPPAEVADDVVYKPAVGESTTIAGKQERTATTAGNNTDGTVLELDRNDGLQKASASAVASANDGHNKMPPPDKKDLVGPARNNERVGVDDTTEAAEKVKAAAAGSLAQGPREKATGVQPKEMQQATHTAVMNVPSPIDSSLVTSRGQVQSSDTAPKPIEAVRSGDRQPTDPAATNTSPTTTGGGVSTAPASANSGAVKSHTPGVSTGHTGPQVVQSPQDSSKSHWTDCVFDVTGCNWTECKPGVSIDRAAWARGHTGRLRWDRPHSPRTCAQAVSWCNEDSSRCHSPYCRNSMICGRITAFGRIADAKPPASRPTTGGPAQPEAASSDPTLATSNATAPPTATNKTGGGTARPGGAGRIVGTVQSVKPGGSIFSQLSTKIQVLERNMSLSGRFLEQIRAKIINVNTTLSQAAVVATAELARLEELALNISTKQERGASNEGTV